MSTLQDQSPAPESRSLAGSLGVGTLTYRAAVLLLLCVIGWNLHGIRHATQSLRDTQKAPGPQLEPYTLESLSWSSKHRFPKDAKVIPVYVINGIDVNRIEGIGGDGSYVVPLKTLVDNPFGVRIDAPHGLQVKIQDQPIRVKVTP